MKALIKIFTILPRKQIIQCVWILLAMCVGAVLESIGIGAILPLISIMGNPDFLFQHPRLVDVTDWLGIYYYTELIVVSAVGLIIVYVIKNVYIAWELHLQISFVCKNQIFYSKALLEEYMGKPYIYHLSHNSATLLRNVGTGSVIVFSNILLPTFMLLTEIITTMAIWVMLVAVDAFTAIIVAGIIVFLIYIILRGFRKKILAEGRRKNKASASYYKWMNQGLGAIKETKVMGKEKFFIGEFDKAYYEFATSNSLYNFFNQVPRLLIEMIVVSGLLVLIIVKLMIGYSPMEIVPLLGVLALAAFRLMPSVNRIIAFANSIKYQLPFFYEIYDELIQIKEKRIRENASILLEDSPTIVFEHEIVIDKLTFRYPHTEMDILKNVSLVIPKGKFIGIVGVSGAGKTTFVDILLGLLQPNEGKIIVDGVDIQYNIRSWQSRLAYVPQNIYLIDGTIRENIAMGIQSDNIDDRLVDEVLHISELYDFIHELPQGIQTIVGERGVKLSGGQRQRIGIARALYQQPEILVLDEATSALDNVTEKSIMDTIIKLKGKVTIISIAHRISTLSACDFKVHFEKGNIFMGD